MQIELKEGKHFDVDKAKGQIHFKARPAKGGMMQVTYGPIEGITKVTMKTGFFSGLWFLLTSRLTRAR